MKVLRSAAGLCCLVVVLFSFDANFSSCQKQIIIDTLTLKDTLTLRDTIKITDTVHIKDSSTCSCYNLKDGLIAYYNFNGGNLNDSSGNNNDIIFNNAVPTADRFGRDNNAYLFDGADSYMQVKNSATLNPTNITISAFVKLNGFYAGICHGNQILQKGTVDQEQGVYSLRVTDLYNDCAITADTTKEQIGGFYGDYNYSSSAYDTSYTRTNSWIKVVYTFDGKQSKIYVDGQLKMVTASNATFTPGTKDIFIGRAESGQYPYWFNGVMDDIRIYNKALCAAAVKQLNDIKN